MSDGCLFCKIIEKKISSRIVYEDQHVLAFEDVNPQAPVHILVIPKKHLPDIQSMTESDRELVGHLFLAATKITTLKNISGKGYRTVINNGADAGQTVFHLHLHILSGRRFAWPPG